MDLGSGDIIPFYVASIESDPDEIDIYQAIQQLNNNLMKIN